MDYANIIQALSGAGGVMNGAGGGGLLGAMKPAAQPAAAPVVPPDGSMQATIGPGAAPVAPVAAPAAPRAGMPQGGLVGLMRGQSPQGILGILQQMSQNGQKVPVPSIPGTEGMQSAGMLSPAFNVQGGGPMNLVPGV